MEEKYKILIISVLILIGSLDIGLIFFATQNNLVVDTFLSVTIIGLFLCFIILPALGYFINKNSKLINIQIIYFVVNILGAGYLIYVSLLVFNSYKVKELLTLENRLILFLIIMLIGCICIPFFYVPLSMALNLTSLNYDDEIFIHRLYKESILSLILPLTLVCLTDGNYKKL